MAHTLITRPLSTGAAGGLSLCHALRSDGSAHTGAAEASLSRPRARRPCSPSLRSTSVPTKNTLCVRNTAARLVGVVLDEERLLDRRLRAGLVLALGGLRVGLRAREELVLRRLVLVLLAAPDLDARRLERARVREGEGEGALAVELVDLVEVDGRVLLRDAAREERDARHGGRQAAVERLHGHLGDRRRVRLVLALDARDRHRRLEQRALEEDAVVAQLLVHGRGTRSCTRAVVVMSWSPS